MAKAEQTSLHTIYGEGDTIILDAPIYIIASNSN